MKKFIKLSILISFISLFLFINCKRPDVSYDFTISPSSITLSPLETSILQVKGESCTIENTDVNWESVDPDIVSVDTSGKITGLQEGKTTITAVYKDDSDITSSCSVTVVPKELILGEYSEGDCTTINTLWYFFTASSGCDYTIAWKDTDNGSYTGDIRVSAYSADREISYFESGSDGSEILSAEKCERVYIKIEGNIPGTFALQYSISGGIPDTWTLLFYVNCFNLEESCTLNLKEMMNGFHDDIGINVVVLIDKVSENDYGIEGLNFSGTGLFTIRPGGLNRVSGGNEFAEIGTGVHPELNMGDPATVRQFIEYGKTNFPAENIALIFIAHGQAAGGFSSDDTIDSDRLHPGELSNELTNDHSVNLLGFNSCLMGNIEVAYEFRSDASNTGFSSDILLAPPGFTNEVGWKYDWAFQRINTETGGTTTTDEETVTGGNEKIYDPAQMSAVELAIVLLEEHRDGMYDYSSTFAQFDSLNCYDLANIVTVKTNLDIMATSLFDNNEKSVLETVRDDENLTIRFFRTSRPTEELNNYERTYYPFYDLKSLCESVAADNVNFSPTTRTAASSVVDAINMIILYSYFGDYVSYDNMYGLSVFFSNGDLLYKDEKMFSYQWWYNAVNVLHITSPQKYYGELAWCIDKENNRELEVDNWFELLDVWYDDPVQNTVNGGYNEYIY